MAEKLNFEGAKRKFKNNNEDIVSYFILVESYEKHLNANQKEKFLNPDTIDDMLNVLTMQQLKHLRSLVHVFYRYKALHGQPGFEFWDYYSEGQPLSAWFLNNVYKKLPSIGISTDRVNKVCWESAFALLRKIMSFESKRTKAKKYVEDLKAKYKPRLAKFGGNSVEYRQWLILFVCSGDSIPNMDRIYSVRKLLNQVPLDLLEFIKKNIEEQDLRKTIGDIKYHEPYFYFKATCDFDERKLTSEDINKLWDTTIDKMSLIPLEKLKKNEECKAMIDARKRLLELIGDVLEEKEEERAEKIREETIAREKKEKEGEKEQLSIAAKLDLLEKRAKLSDSSLFYQEAAEIMRSLKGEDDESIKHVISAYSRVGEFGSYYNDYFRRAVLQEMLRKAGKYSGQDILLFKRKILKICEYFERHLTSREYTVYRGMKWDGLMEILGTANPKVEYYVDASTMEEIAEELKKKKPIVFDDGLVSTSLNKGVSAGNFHGYEDWGVLFTIKIPAHSKALVLDYEELDNIPEEEEVLLAPGTKIRIKSAEVVGTHCEIDAEVVE